MYVCLSQSAIQELRSSTGYYGVYPERHYNATVNIFHVLERISYYDKKALDMAGFTLPYPALFYHKTRI